MYICTLNCGQPRYIGIKYRNVFDISSPCRNSQKVNKRKQMSNEIALPGGTRETSSTNRGRTVENVYRAVSAGHAVTGFARYTGSPRRLHNRRVLFFLSAPTTLNRCSIADGGRLDPATDTRNPTERRGPFSFRVPHVLVDNSDDYGTREATRPRTSRRENGGKNMKKIQRPILTCVGHTTRIE